VKITQGMISDWQEGWVDFSEEDPIYAGRNLYYPYQDGIAIVRVTERSSREVEAIAISARFHSDIQKYKKFIAEWIYLAGENVDEVIPLLIEIGHIKPEPMLSPEFSLDEISQAQDIIHGT